MSTEKDNTAPVDTVVRHECATGNDATDGLAQAPDMPTGWKYRERRLFGLKIPAYASPTVQLLLVSFVCFMCPGMFNALGGLGGGGKTNPTLADNMVRVLTCLSL